MNEALEKKTLYNKIKDNYKKNTKFYISFVVFIIIILLSYQLYSFYKVNKIHKSSLEYSRVINLKTSPEYIQELENLSLKKDFYSILAKLEKINYHIETKDLDLAYDIYLDLLNDKILNNIYIGIIALHGSYNLLNFEEFSTNKENIIEKIYNLISFVDPKIQSYYGLRLEILFLLSLIENNNINNENTIKLYNEIQESNTITTSLKERVKKIHDFNKYK
tara:strand:- start:377 stop:1036 length:660 start_codon:yes stop_codon:yes gene_type:complete